MRAANIILSRLEGDLRMAGKAPGTIQQYVASIRRFQEFLGLDPAEARQDVIRS
jgi:integrase/recombinase XerD